MPSNWSFVSGDTGSTLKVTCKDNESGAVIDLTGGTVRLRWKNSSGTEIERVMTLVDAANGVASYQFAAGELEAPRMKFEVEITDAAGKIITSVEPLVHNVREEIG